MSPSLTDLWAAFVRALEEVGLAADVNEDTHSGVIEDVPVVVRVVAVPSAAEVLAFDRVRTPGRYKILIGRRISSDVRTGLAQRGIGFFDGRGRLRIWHHPVLVDAEVAGVAPGLSEPSGPDFAIPSTMDVALAVLEGVVAAGIRSSAAIMGRSPGTVSKQLAVLRVAQLVDESGHPTIPDLFDAVLEEWKPTRLPLAEMPRPGGGLVNGRLELGFDDNAARGWVLADTAAAAAWGAPIVRAGDAPPDFYVPEVTVVGEARTLLGTAAFGSHACTISVAPCPIVCRRRYKRGQVFPAPSPVVAALDLASDRARGRETLDLWSENLSAEVRRVW
jgi:hypothetical protein